MSLFPFLKNITRFGIIRISVANLRRQPVYAAELLNQALLGEVLPILEEQEYYCFVQMKDGYRGWIAKHSMELVTEEKAHYWHDKATSMVEVRHSLAHSEANSESEVISDLAFGAKLIPNGEEDTYQVVELPNSLRAFIKKDHLTDINLLTKQEKDISAITKTAKKFLGVPYLWGGTSSKGFDCSGLVQTVFGLHQINLPRDSSQMIHLGDEVNYSPQFENILPGDLLFFGNTLQRITHVAISLGGTEYIHAEGWVKYNSFDPTSHIFNKEKATTLVSVKRIA